jgi:hypothetical protein
MSDRPRAWSWRAIVVFAIIWLAACGSSPSATPTPSPSAVGKPIVACLGGLNQATCDEVLPIVLRTVAPSGWTPTHLWINSGSLAPIPELLFDPAANFPAPILPSGSTPLGNAEVEFAETTKHAGINLALAGSAVVADLVGYVAPLPGWCSGSCSG